MKILGIAALLLAVLYFANEQAKTRAKSVLYYEETDKYLAHLRDQVACYMSDAASAALSFKSELFSSRGFFEKVKSGADMDSAFGECGIYDRLSEKAQTVLHGLFENFGSGYVDSELKRLDTAISEFSSIVKKEREQAPKNAKLIRTLGVTVALGVLILFI